MESKLIDIAKRPNVDDLYLSVLNYDTVLEKQFVKKGSAQIVKNLTVRLYDENENLILLTVWGENALKVYQFFESICKDSSKNVLLKFNIIKDITDLKDIYYSDRLLWVINFNPSSESFSKKSGYNYEINLIGRVKFDLKQLIKILPEVVVDNNIKDNSNWVIPNPFVSRTEYSKEEDIDFAEYLNSVKRKRDSFSDDKITEKTKKSIKK